MTSHLPGLLFVIPFFAAIMIPVVGLSNTKLCRPIALGALLLLSLVSLWTFDEVVSSGPLSYAFGGWAPPIGIEWVVDGLSGLLMIVVSVVALLALVHAGPFVQRELPGRVIPFYSLSLLLVTALGGMLLTGDLFNLFVFLEIGSLASYVLVGVTGGRSLLSAFRYLILGTIGASLYLLGVGYLCWDWESRWVCFLFTDGCRMLIPTHRMPPARSLLQSSRRCLCMHWFAFPFGFLGLAP